MQQQAKNSIIIGFGWIVIIGVIILTAYLFSRLEISLNLGVVIGVWWWDINLDTSIYFPFCAQQNVSEIYLNVSSLNSSVNTFIQDANNHNISVYYVQSDKNLILNPTLAIDKLNEYREFNKTYPINTFKGIIYDIDLRLFSDYEENRDYYYNALLTFMDDVIINNTDIQIDFTISEQLWEDFIFKEQNQTFAAYIMDYSHSRVFVKANAVTYNSMIDQTEYEILYTDYMNKTIILTLNTVDTGEADSNITFYGQGQHILHQEISYFASVMNNNDITKYGFSIVHMKSWYDLSY
jgi:hypothetical protein